MTHCPILVVEDDTSLRETMQDLLELEGFQVITAEHGAAALHALDEIGTPCLILLDLMMPVMNGWEFLARIRERDDVASIPITVVTAASDATDVSHYGCQVMRKPVDIDHLYGLAHEHCDTLG